MSKFKALLLSMILLVSCRIFAQDYTRFELSAGYSYGSVNTQGYGDQRNAQGWNSSLTTNLKRWVGLEMDVSGRYNNLSFLYQNVNLSYNSTYYSFLGGPRFAYRKGKAVPFVHGLFGVERGPDYGNTVYDPATATATTPYNTGLASAAGGGIDYYLNRRISFRTQADYFFTRYAAATTSTPNNFRILAAVVFNFGGSSSLDAHLPPAPPVKPQQPDPAVANTQPPAAPAPAPQQTIVPESNSTSAQAKAEELDSEPIPVVTIPEVTTPVFTHAADSTLKANVQGPASQKTAPSAPAQPMPTSQAASSMGFMGQNTVIISSASELQAATQPQQQESLGDIARRYRQKKQAADKNADQPGF